MQEEKRVLRKQIAVRKAAYTDLLLEQLSKKLFQCVEMLPVFREASVVLLYHSLKDEVRTHAFIEKWKDSKQILLPVVVGDELIIRLYKGADELVIGSYGIAEPIGTLFTAYQEIDLALVPGISFDSYGNRLGRGKGYYDRLLPQLSAYKLGICFSFQVSERIPVSPHDVPMDGVCTEEGVL